ncbi:NAD(P)H-hydrate dehydratase [Shewanella sp. GXUN23E]|uniref:NAD(P)H-hydrate dehydratase n=1 Tax=Shewanella sp. GXUN23E TaxID=3422498 RepID=UPI003D7D1116
MSLSALPSQLYLCSQIRQAELAMVQSTDVSLLQLVERAAHCAATTLSALCSLDKVLLLAGSGNNGSDALLMASLLTRRNIDCLVLRVQANRYSDEHLAVMDMLSKTQVRVDELNESTLTKALGEYDIVVDGLLGSGIQGIPRKDMMTYIDMVNRAGRFVFSLDIPSGIDADTGRIVGRAIAADATLCLGAVKRGLLTCDARDCCGQLYFGDIGLAPFLPDAAAVSCDLNLLTEKLPPRRRNSHKGSHGKVCVVGGDRGMVGAVRLASEACLRAGAGLVCVISRQEHLPLVCASRPELMFHGCELVDMEAYHKLGWADVLVVGPGLGTDDWGYNLMKAVALANKPILLDADGLNLLASEADYSDMRVITPHPAEAARLLDCSTAEVQNDRFAAAQKLQQIYGGVVVLKGAGTIIYDGNTLCVAPVGNPGLASGGCGDVLSGIIGALMAQGLDLMSAAVAGVIIHGGAADLAAASGERGMLATDLMTGIRKLVNPCMIQD